MTAMCNAGTAIYKDGIRIGRIKELYALVADGLLTLQQALRRAGVTEPEFFEIAKTK